MYYSPLHLTGELTHPGELALARRKALAELDLSGTSGMTVNSRRLDRQDILHLFDELRTPTQQAWHQAIFKDEALLKFLERAVVSTAQWQHHPLYDDPRFLAFVSPLFATAVNELLQHCLKGEDTPFSYNLIVHRRQLLLMHDVDACFDYTRRFFLERKAALQQIRLCLSEGGGSYQAVADPVTRQTVMRYVFDEQVNVREIEDWCTPAQLSLLNALPDDHFGDLRYALASELNQICVICDEAGANYRLAYLALSTAATIHCGAALNKTIQDNLLIIQRKMSGGRLKAPGGTDSTLSWKTVLFIMLIIIRLLCWIMH